jgi:hypothetical protein
MRSYSLLKVFFFVILIFLTGCLESSFQLSRDSRLPKWFIYPEGIPRSDLSVTMDLYSSPSGGKDVIKLLQKGKIFALQKHTITTNMQPNIKSVELKSPPAGFPKGYPRYKVIIINSITEIIELRKMEPFFYMTDDPAVWKELGVDQNQ